MKKNIALSLLLMLLSGSIHGTGGKKQPNKGVNNQLELQINQLRHQNERLQKENEELAKLRDKGLASYKALINENTTLKDNNAKLQAQCDNLKARVTFRQVNSNEVSSELENELKVYKTVVAAGVVIAAAVTAIMWSKGQVRKIEIN